MGYFDDIMFVHAGRHPEYRSDIKGSIPKTYSLEWNNRGTMRFAWDGGRPATLSGPFAFWLEPGRRYDYGPPTGTSRDHAFLCFVGPRGERFSREGLAPLSNAPWARVSDPVAFRELFHETVALVDSSGPGPNPAAAVNLERLLLLLTSRQAGGEESEPERRARELARSVAAAPFKTYDLRRLAKTEFHLSYRQFTRLFQRAVHAAPHEHLLSCRARAAAALLLRGDRSVKEVADACGYDDPSLFSRDFKRRVGCAPSVYKSVGRR